MTVFQSVQNFAICEKNVNKNIQISGPNPTRSDPWVDLTRVQLWTKSLSSLPDGILTKASVACDFASAGLLFLFSIL
jgi:hypothetical protein